MRKACTYLMVFVGVWFMGWAAVPPSGVPAEAKLPAFEWYASWDTSEIHYRGPIQFPQNDTVNLSLVRMDCDYVNPAPGPTTSGFGRRWRRMHYGIDLDLETGDQVVAAFEGMVRFAAYNGSYGNLVIVRHPNGLETYYAHLSELKVQPGDYLQAGEVLGLGGNTGRSYGSHLHFEMRFLGLPFNPAHVIDFDSGKPRFECVDLYLKRGYLDCTNGEKFHVVHPGEDLYAIAHKYQVDVNQLADLNGLSPNDILPLDLAIRYH